MDKNDFYYLFVNTNCLAELALRPSGDDIAGILNDVETVPSPLSDTEAAVAAGFEGLDLDALDGMAFFGDDSEADIQESSADSPSTIADGDQFEIEEFDINRYMEKAYSYQDYLQDRIDRSFAEVDHERLDTLISQLDTGLQPITARQSGQDIEKWLDLYKSEHVGVTEIVVAIRQIDAHL